MALAVLSALRFVLAVVRFVLAVVGQGSCNGLQIGFEKG